jgi:hypothetical protein
VSEFNSNSRPTDEVFSLPAKAESIYFAGRLLAVDLADGRAVAAADAARRVVLGRIETTIDNSAGANGDRAVPYRLGTFRFKNSTAHPLTAARYGQPCFIEDDITVSASAGTNNVFAGFFRGFDALGDGVWVDLRPLPLLAAFFGNNADSNFRFSSSASGAPIFQLWNQDQQAFQTVQLAGAAGAERLIIAAAET